MMTPAGLFSQFWEKGCGVGSERHPAGSVGVFADLGCDVPRWRGRLSPVHADATKNNTLTGLARRLGSDPGGALLAANHSPPISTLPLIYNLWGRCRNAPCSPHRVAD